MSVYDIADIARLAWSRTWRWLVWSPRRLGAVVGAVIAIVIGWTQLSGTGPVLPSDETQGAYASDDLPGGWQDWQVVTAHPETDTPATEPVTQAPTTTPPPTNDTDPKESRDESNDDHAAHQPPSKQTQQKAKAAAYAFAKSYVHSERSRKAWYAKVAPHAVEALRKPLKTVNPKNIRARKITGKTTIDSLGDMGGRIVVPTNTGKLVLGVTRTGSGWAVSKVIPPVQKSSPR
ncbi:hypothetical protein MU582_18445 [Nocardioidaceae bacterium SCSIO 66511]|nr:hypothetical protein MU582_18445 [Nocardioidaceae bacterium SCSIO 66511]